MTTHHEAAQDNIREVVAGMNELNGQSMKADHALAAFTRHGVIAQLATAQALLAVNETLQKIAHPEA